MSPPIYPVVHRGVEQVFEWSALQKFIETKKKVREKVVWHTNPKVSLSEELIEPAPWCVRLACERRGAQEAQKVIESLGKWWKENRDPEKCSLPLLEAGTWWELWNPRDVPSKDAEMIKGQMYCPRTASDDRAESAQAGPTSDQQLFAQLQPPQDPIRRHCLLNTLLDELPASGVPQEEPAEQALVAAGSEKPDLSGMDSGVSEVRPGGM